MSTLYEIHADLNALAGLLAEVGGDVTDAEAEAAVDAWLRETDEAMREKLDRYAALIREMEERAGSRKAEADRLAALANADASGAKRLKDRLRWFLEEQGLDKVETPRFRVSLANNGGKAPVRWLVGPDALPDEWREVVVSYRPKTDEARALLEAGAGVEAMPYAVLESRGKHVRIK